MWPNPQEKTISVYHDPIPGVSVGQNDGLSDLLSGIFNNRPTQPKFNFNRDVKKVLDFLLTLECDENPSLKRLALKLTMLSCINICFKSLTN